jgi:hypothetical protein
VGRNLFGSALRGDVLSLWQQGAACASGKRDEVVGDRRHRASCTPLPWRVGRRIDDHLADDSPAGVMRITARNKESRERLGDLLGFGIGRMAVEMPQRCVDIAATVHGSCQGPCGWPRSMSRIVDQSTVPPARPPMAAAGAVMLAVQSATRGSVAVRSGCGDSSNR